MAWVGLSSFAAPVQVERYSSCQRTSLQAWSPEFDSHPPTQMLGMGQRDDSSSKSAFSASLMISVQNPFKGRKRKPTAWRCPPVYMYSHTSYVHMHSHTLTIMYQLTYPAKNQTVVVHHLQQGSQMAFPALAVPGKSSHWWSHSLLPLHRPQTGQITTLKSEVITKLKQSKVGREHGALFQIERGPIVLSHTDTWTER